MQVQSQAAVVPKNVRPAQRRGLTCPRTPRPFVRSSRRRAADLWQSEHDAIYPTTPTPHRRVSNYRRHVVRWEEKLARAVDAAAQVPEDFQRGRVFSLLPQAWCDVFERHVEIGERLARAELSPLLSTHHAEVLAAVRERWPFRSERGPTTHMRRQIPLRRAG
jgi:hypothetical protein